MKNTIKNFIASISYDNRLLEYDIAGSIAHCRMLARCRIITMRERDRIIAGLLAILHAWRKGGIKFSSKDEDIHLAIERMLIEKIGDVGGKLHTARSRNDQVSLDMRLYLRDRIGEIIESINVLKKTIKKKASANINVIMPGFTHLQHAQPVLFSHYMMAYCFMLERDEERLKGCLERVNVMPLGASALAGTSFHIDRNYVAHLLSFPKITENSIDTVSDRDFIIEFIQDASIILMHLSRFCEDLIIWASPEFSFVSFAPAFSTGSSIMPQKRNPDVAELIRAKTGKVYGNLIGILTVMKGLPLSYNRDMQEDKQGMFDTADTLEDVLKIFAQMLGSIRINEKRMLRACEKGFLNATDVADYLVGKGVPFRNAHGIVSRLVSYCMEKGKRMEDLNLDEFRGFSKKFSKDVLSLLDVRKSINRRNSKGGTSLSQVRREIRKKT